MRYLFNPYVALLLVLWFITRAFQAIDGLYAISSHLLSLEIVFILYLYAWFQFLLKPDAYRPWLAALPIVQAYLTFDIFFVAYGRFFHLSEFEELPELLAVMPWFYSLLFALPVVLPLLWFFSRIDYQKRRLSLLAGAPLFALILVIAYAPQTFLKLYGKLNRPAVSWSDQYHVTDNGRFMVFMHRQAVRRQALQSSRHQLNWNAFRRDKAAKISKLAQQGGGQNIHLVVLESFFEPNSLAAVQYARDPAHPDYRLLFGDKVNNSISPVFGGSTAQAEFEVLCGFPAFSLYSNVEFNAFGGTNVACLPGVLAQVGYRSLASNAFRPDFFNTLAAYKGIGFEEMYFAKEFSRDKPSYFSTGKPDDDSFFMNDEDLFNANLNLVEAHINSKPDTPLFNYILSIYGHFPHELHDGQSPHTDITQSPYQDSFLDNVAQQYYYRTEAITRYTQRLMQIDPESLIIFISDHLPPLSYGKRSYQRLQYQQPIYQVPLLVIEAGEVRQYPLLHHYDIPDLIQNYLTQGKHCQQQPCNLEHEQKPKAAYEADYKRFMAHALF